MSSARMRMLHAGLILLLVIACYGHTLGYPFHLDDGMFIHENPMVTRPSTLFHPDRLLLDPSMLDAVTGSRITRWLGYASFRMNYVLGGLDVRGYHAVNIAVHAACGLLVYAIALMSLSAPAMKGLTSERDAQWIALFAAAIFIAHPLQTQAVTYIAQRFASMAAMFCLASMACYIKWRLGGRGLWLALAAGSAAAAMITKENSFVLPVAIALHEYCFFPSREGGRRPYAGLALMAATMLIVPAAVAYSSSKGVAGATIIHEEVTRWEYLITQFAVVVTYLRMLILPYGQNLDHDYPLYTSLLSPVPLASLCLLALVAAFALRGYLRCAARGGCGAAGMLYTGALWVFVFLSVESSVVVLVNLIFEHRMYLPMAGVSLGVAGICAAAAGRPSWRRPLAALAVSVVVALGAASHERNRVWSSEVALWSDAASKSPLKPRPRTSLAKAYADAGMHAEAEAEYKRALELDPAHNVDVRPEAMYNLGILYNEMGRSEDAQRAYAEQLERFPGVRASVRAMSHYNLGNLYLRSGQMEEAATQWRLALQEQPNHPKALNQLGNYHAMKGETKPAEASYRGSLASNPDNYEAAYNLARLLESMGRAQEARAMYDEAARIRSRQ